MGWVRYKKLEREMKMSGSGRYLEVSILRI